MYDSHLPYAIEPERLLTVCNEMMEANEGDEATQEIILAIAANTLDITKQDVKKALPMYKD